MIWTKELPTEPGWYWHDFGSGIGKGCVKLVRERGQLVSQSDNEQRPVKFWRGLWYGPLTPPATPGDRLEPVRTLLKNGPLDSRYALVRPYIRSDGNAAYPSWILVQAPERQWIYGLGLLQHNPRTVGETFEHIYCYHEGDSVEDVLIDEFAPPPDEVTELEPQEANG